MLYTQKSKKKSVGVQSNNLGIVFCKNNKKMILSGCGYFNNTTLVIVNFFVRG